MRRIFLFRLINLLNLCHAVFKAMRLCAMIFQRCYVTVLVQCRRFISIIKKTIGLNPTYDKKMAIILGGNRIMEINETNKIWGIVKEIEYGESMSKVVIEYDGGELISIIPTDTVNVLCLQSGSDITALVKATDVMIINGGVTKNKCVLGFFVEWFGEDRSSYNDLVKNASLIDTIIPFWATLEEDGSLKNRGGNDHDSVVQYAHRHEITAILMINNANQKNPNKGLHAILANPLLCKAAIENIKKFIDQHDLDGINIDFELVPASDRDKLTAFISELSRRLKPEGYIVSIAVFPKHNEENEIAVAYDYAQLAQYVDGIALMTYDYHADWSGPGPIADIRSVETDLQYALTLIPKNEVYLGVAGYGYDWSKKGVKSLEYREIRNLINRFHVDVVWDNASKSPHFDYNGVDGTYHQVWFEDRRSLKYKIDLVNKYDIQGIAFWKLGDEDPAFWQVVKNHLNQQYEEE